MHSSDAEEKWEYNETVHEQFTDSRKEVFYNILIEFKVTMMLVTLIIMRLNEHAVKFIQVNICPINV
jgi:hypothetical protein